MTGVAVRAPAETRRRRHHGGFGAGRGSGIGNIGGNVGHRSAAIRGTTERLQILGGQVQHAHNARRQREDDVGFLVSLWL